MSVVHAPTGGPDLPPPPRWLQRLQAPSGVIDTGPVLRRWQRTAGWAAEWMARSGHLVARYTSAVGKVATEPLLLIAPVLPSGVDGEAINLPGAGAVRPPEAPGVAPAVAASQPPTGAAAPALALLQRWQRRTDTVQALQRRSATSLLGASATAGVVDPVLYQRLVARAGVPHGTAVTTDAAPLRVVTPPAAEPVGSSGRVAATAPGLVSGVGVLTATESMSPGQPMQRAQSARQHHPGDAGHGLPVHLVSAPSRPTVDIFGGLGPMSAATGAGRAATAADTLAAVPSAVAWSPSPAADALLPARQPDESTPVAATQAAAGLSRATGSQSLARPADPPLSTKQPTLVLARQVEPGRSTGPTAEAAHNAVAQHSGAVPVRSFVAPDPAVPEPPGGAQALAHQAPPTPAPSSSATARPGAFNAVPPQILLRAPEIVARMATPLAARQAGPTDLAGLPTAAALAAPSVRLQRDASAMIARSAAAGTAALVRPAAALVWQWPATAAASIPGSAVAAHHLMRSSTGDDRGFEASRPSAPDAGAADTPHPRSAPPAPGPDLAELAEQVTRLIARRLEIERERRGSPR